MEDLPNCILNKITDMISPLDGYHLSVCSKSLTTVEWKKYSTECRHVYVHEQILHGRCCICWEPMENDKTDYYHGVYGHKYCVESQTYGVIKEMSLKDIGMSDSPTKVNTIVMLVKEMYQFLAYKHTHEHPAYYKRLQTRSVRDVVFQLLKAETMTLVPDFDDSKALVAVIERVLQSRWVDLQFEKVSDCRNFYFDILEAYHAITEMCRPLMEVFSTYPGMSYTWHSLMKRYNYGPTVINNLIGIWRLDPNTFITDGAMDTLKSYIRYALSEYALGYVCIQLGLDHSFSTNQTLPCVENGREFTMKSFQDTNWNEFLYDLQIERDCTYGICHHTDTDCQYANIRCIRDTICIDKDGNLAYSVDVFRD